MRPEERLAQLQAEAAELRVKLNESGLTEKDRGRAQELADESEKIRGEIQRDRDLSAQLETASSTTRTRIGEGEGEVTADGPAGSTAGFTQKVMGAFKAAGATVGGPAVGKALTPSGSVVSDFDGRVISDPKAAHTLLSAVNTDQTEEPAGQYLRQTVRESNADTVASGDLKPSSRFELAPVRWRVATIAHLSQPMQRQWIADYEALNTFISTELAYGDNGALENLVLNGGVDEDGDTVPGLLTTTGVPQTDYHESPLLSIRRALRQAEELGAVVSGIAVSPTDWEAIDAAQLTDGAYLLAGAPTTAPARTLWGIPVTVTNALPAGTAVAGNLKTITVRYRNSLQLSWAESVTDVGTAEAPDLRDLFRRNQLVFRAEARAALEIASLKDIRVVDLAAA